MNPVARISGASSLVRSSLRAHGLFGTIPRVMSVGIDICGDLDGWLFDRRFRIDTGGFDPGLRYRGTFPTWFKHTLNSLSIRHEEFVFIDIGSGKGRALMLANSFPFRRIVGIELDRSLHKIANKNLAIWRTAHPRAISPVSLCMDAREYQFPLDPCVIFLFNPFPGPVLERVCGNLAKSLNECPRPIRIIYQRPLYRDVIDACSSLRVIVDHTTPIYGGRRLVIYAERSSSVNRGVPGNVGAAYGIGS